MFPIIYLFKWGTITYLRRALRGLRHGIKTIRGNLTKFWIFSEFDGIPEPPREFKLLEGGTLTNLRRAPRLGG